MCCFGALAGSLGLRYSSSRSRSPCRESWGSPKAELDCPLVRAFNPHGRTIPGAPAMMLTQPFDSHCQLDTAPSQWSLY